MVRVDILLQVISQHPLASVAAIRTLQQYMRGFLAKEGTFEVESLNHFVDSTLHFPFWVENRKELLADLVEFFESDITQQKIGFLDLRDWAKGVPEQVFEVQQTRELCDLVNCYLTFQLRGKGTQFRLVSSHSKEVIAIALHPNQSVEVYQFTNKFVIRAGHLEPLLRGNRLLFNSHDLGLEEECRHQVLLSGGQFAVFEVDDPQEELVSGGVFSGHLFERKETFYREKLMLQPKLFYLVRKLESLFLSRANNPFYQLVIQGLETLRLEIKSGQTLPTHTFDLLARAEVAREQVFENDQVLDLLLREINLEISARQKGTSTGKG